jgi:phosphatidylserine decarboxylase
MDTKEIKIWNLKTQHYFVEKIYGGKGMAWVYQNKTLPRLSRKFITQKWMSKCVGHFYNTHYSAKLIPQFIEKFSIPIQEFESKEYRSFNEFFIRKFKAGQRLFSPLAKELSAPAEGRYLAFTGLKLNSRIEVKGLNFSLQELIHKQGIYHSDDELNLVIARLCPVDYHRYHYPCDGEVLEHFSVTGPLESVHPIAMATNPAILATNERMVSLLNTQSFGKMTYIEVGALFVGSIIQSHQDQQFTKGQEKGYFLFGGSTVILVGRTQDWKIHSEILTKSKEGIECYLNLGQSFAESQKP